MIFMDEEILLAIESLTDEKKNSLNTLISEWEDKVRSDFGIINEELFEEHIKSPLLIISALLQERGISVISFVTGTILTDQTSTPLNTGWIKLESPTFVKEMEIVSLLDKFYASHSSAYLAQLVAMSQPEFSALKNLGKEFIWQISIEDGRTLLADCADQFDRFLKFLLVEYSLY